VRRYRISNDAAPLIPPAGMSTIPPDEEPTDGSPFREGEETMTEQVKAAQGSAHGYIKEGDKEKLRNRLKRIEGQVRGVQRMIEEEKYCVDILTQISSYIAASEKVAALVLRDHMDHCVREAVEDGSKADEKIQELAEAVERFVKLD
jgi:CsoR family transcriptional regulator, copper-sensing transcriptional repressor